LEPGIAFTVFDWILGLAFSRSHLAKSTLPVGMVSCSERFEPITATFLNTNWYEIFLLKTACASSGNSMRADESVKHWDNSYRLEVQLSKGGEGKGFRDPF